MHCFPPVLLFRTHAPLIFANVKIQYKAHGVTEGRVRNPCWECLTNVKGSFHYTSAERPGTQPAMGGHGRPFALGPCTLHRNRTPQRDDKGADRLSIDSKSKKSNARRNLGSTHIGNCNNRVRMALIRSVHNGRGMGGSAGSGLSIHKLFLQYYERPTSTAKAGPKCAAWNKGKARGHP